MPIPRSASHYASGFRLERLAVVFVGGMAAMSLQGCTEREDVAEPVATELSVMGGDEIQVDALTVGPGGELYMGGAQIQTFVTGWAEVGDTLIPFEERVQTLGGGGTIFQDAGKVRIFLSNGSQTVLVDELEADLSQSTRVYQIPPGITAKLYAVVDFPECSFVQWNTNPKFTSNPLVRQSGSSLHEIRAFFQCNGGGGGGGEDPPDDPCIICP